MFFGWPVTKCYALARAKTDLGNSMRRRDFITVLGGAAFTGPFAVSAQQTDRMRRVGVLTGRS